MVKRPQKFNDGSIKNKFEMDAKNAHTINTLEGENLSATINKPNTKVPRIKPN
jgi:hypothetical protein